MSNDILNVDVGRYGKDAPFEDPIVQCGSCNKVVRRDYVHRYGSCSCGGRRFKTVYEYDDELVDDSDFDPEFRARFQPGPLLPDPGKRPE